MVRLNSAVAALAVAAPFAAAQTFSACDSTKKTGCPPNPGLNSAEYSVDFTKGQPSDWKTTSGSVDYGADGGVFSIKQLGDGPTIQSDFHIFFGYVEVKMKSAPGQGIVSSLVLQSDVLDETDWEMIGSNTTHVQSNYFGKGNTTTYDRGAFHAVKTPADTYHTYAVNWTKESTIWLIDGAPVRTIKSTEALGGKNYPQTPSNIRIGNWVAGDPKNQAGTIQWAGGLADMTKGPYNMLVQSVKVINYNPAASYSYGDQSGSAESIKLSTESVSAVTNSTTSGESGAGVGAEGPGSAGTVTIRPGDSKGGVSTSCTKKGAKATGASGHGSGSGSGSGSGYGSGSSSGHGSGSGSGSGSESGSGSGSNSRGLARPSHTQSLSPGGIAQTVTIRPQATGAAASNSSSGASGSSNGGIVAQGVPKNSTASTVSFNVGGASPTGAQAQSAGAPSSLATFGLGSGTASARPAQVTTNAAARATGSMSALVVVLGLLALLS